MNGRGPNQHGSRPGGPGGGPRPQSGGVGGARPTGGGGGGGHGGGVDRPREEPIAQRIERRLRDKTRIDYFAGSVSSDQPPSPRKELFDEEAETLAKKIASIPASQLRRFYSVVQTIKRKLDLDKELGADFIKAELALLKARGAYALARLGYKPDPSKGYEPDELLTMLVRHGNSIEDRRSFLAFARHFEAVMAYHKVFEDKRADRRND